MSDSGFGQALFAPRSVKDRSTLPGACSPGNVKPHQTALEERTLSKQGDEWILVTKTMRSRKPGVSLTPIREEESFDDTSLPELSYKEAIAFKKHRQGNNKRRNKKESGIRRYKSYSPHGDTHVNEQAKWIYENLQGDCWIDWRDKDFDFFQEVYGVEDYTFVTCEDRICAYFGGIYFYINNCVCAKILLESQTNIHYSLTELHNEFLVKKITPECPSDEDSVPSIVDTDDEVSTTPSIDNTQVRNNCVRAAASNAPLPDHNDSLFAKIMESYSKTAANAQEVSGSEYFSYAEDVIILAYQIYRARSFVDVAMAAAAYAKSYTKKSLLHTMLELLDSVVPQSEEVSKEDTDVHVKWWSASETVDHWERFKTNTVYKHISYLISVVLAMSCCSQQNIDFNIAGMKVIEIEALKQQADAIDVIDACLKTFEWMATCGVRCIQERSLTPLLYSDERIREFNEGYEYVILHANAVITGNSDIKREDFRHKVDGLLEVSDSMAKAKDAPLSTWLSSRIKELVRIKERLVGVDKHCRMKYYPFGLALTGSTRVGKSTMSDLMMVLLLNASGFSTDPERIRTFSKEKYDTNMASDVLGVKYDDVNNEVAEFNENPVTPILIRDFNCVPAQANMADVEDKGTVFINSKVGIVTSNLPDFDVAKYSNCPQSVLGRFLFGRVRVKEKYRKPGSTALNVQHPDIVNATSILTDVWDVDLEEVHVYETRAGVEKYKFRTCRETIVRNGKEETIICKDLGLKDLCAVLAKRAKEHAENQKRVLSANKDVHKEELCTCCNVFKKLCVCGQTKENIDPNMAMDSITNVVQSAATQAMTSYLKSWWSPISVWNYLLGYKPVSWLTTKQLRNEMKMILDETATPAIISLTPQWCFDSPTFQRLLRRYHSTAALYDSRWWIRCATIAGLCVSGRAIYKRDPKTLGVAMTTTWATSMLCWVFYRGRVRKYQEEWCKRKDALKISVREWTPLRKCALGMSTMIVVFGMIRVWNQTREALPHMDPDSETSWLGSMFRSIGVRFTSSPKLESSTNEQVVSALQRNNCFTAKIRFPTGETGITNVFFPRKSVMFLPEHSFHPYSDMNKPPADYIDVEIDRCTGKPGSVFKCRLEHSFCAHSEQHDLSAAFVPNCPDLKTRIEWLPIDRPEGTSVCSFMYTMDGKKFVEDVTVNHGSVGHKHRDFWGGSYKCGIARSGACMGLIINKGKRPAIMGFHIGGNPKVSHGVMQTVTQKEAKDLIIALSSKPGVILSAETGEIPTTQYGRELIVNTDPHSKSQFATMGSEACVEVYGSTPARSQVKSRVERSILADSVEKHFSVENKWGPPKLLPNWRAYNKTLEHVVNPSGQFKPSELERARQDWLKPLRSLAVDFGRKDIFRPLTFRESIMGIPGVRFLDALKMSTGSGSPLFGPKSKHFTEVHDDNGILVDRVPAPYVVAEVERLENCYRKGVRGYPITLAMLKDEPTDITSDKARVFQVGALAFSIVLRKYFLPIARFLGCHPLETECAVGINCMSPQWDELNRHAYRHLNYLGWDYSKYDVRMNSQITRAVLTTYIELAQLSGNYSEDDVHIMSNLIVDLVHPMIDWNGTLIMAFNMNTSGNNLTVQINSTANSFYTRMGFFSCYPEKTDFRTYVAITTYGDDLTGSVSDACPNFTYVFYKKFMGDHGIKITPPDKEDRVFEYLTATELEFLKRVSVYIPEIGLHLGALGEDSILKSLLCNIRSKEATRLEVAISCIEAAMHEWFAHGRIIYELRQFQMGYVCQDMNISLPAVRMTFDERVEEWKKKYKSS
ncbi:hypothetical protein 1 [Beihai picorna-like virus 18]|uniref:hypothetical protein 1 n=1 Tax=Beihai picorna-like virus 18 TaxID=1922560 RepID=UPI000909FE7A|nr:hypothetical protein 1 [Beihai picorna-like virus 18]APG76869.1 hypothetical protein 1 [Beihai picorna-like virus 18]